MKIAIAAAAACLVFAACAIGEIGTVGSSGGSSSFSSGSSSSAPVIPESCPSNVLVLLSIDPPTNSVVDSNTVVTAVLEYFIASNETTQHHFALIQQIPMTMPGTGIVTSNVVLTQRHGVVTFTLLLGNVWPVTGVQHPISMMFTLCNYSDALISTALFTISNVEFRE